MNYYTLIQAHWFSTNGNALDMPPHLQPFENKARFYNEKLSKLFVEPIEQFNDGLISSTELLDKLVYEAYRDRTIDEDTGEIV